MSLPARQQRMLDGIEGELRDSEPHLTTMLAIFTKLTVADGPAMPERLRRSRLSSSGSRGVALIPVLIAMLVTGVVLGGTARGATRCGQAARTQMAVAGGLRSLRVCRRPPAPRQPASRQPASRQ